MFHEYSIKLMLGARYSDGYIVIPLSYVVGDGNNNEEEKVMREN